MKTRKLTVTQKAYLEKFASGELNATSRGSSGAVAICRNLTKRGWIASQAEVKK